MAGRKSAPALLSAWNNFKWGILLFLIQFYASHLCTHAACFIRGNKTTIFIFARSGGALSGRSEVYPKMELDLGGAVPWRVVEEFFVRTHTQVDNIRAPVWKSAFFALPRQASAEMCTIIVRMFHSGVMEVEWKSVGPKPGYDLCLCKVVTTTNAPSHGVRVQRTLRTWCVDTW